MQTGPSPVIVDPTTAFLALLSALTAYASQQKTNITKQARELCTSAIEKPAQEPDVSYALDLPIVRQAVLFRILGHWAAVVHLILGAVLAGIAGLVLFCRVAP